MTTLKYSWVSCSESSCDEQIEGKGFGVLGTEKGYLVVVKRNDTWEQKDGSVFPAVENAKTSAEGVFGNLKQRGLV